MSKLNYDSPECFQTFHECSEQKQWDLYRRARIVADIACRLVDHQRNTASSMPTEHCEAHIEGRMRLRAMLHAAVDEYRAKTGGE